MTVSELPSERDGGHENMVAEAEFAYAEMIGLPTDECNNRHNRLWAATCQPWFWKVVDLNVGNVKGAKAS